MSLLSHIVDSNTSHLLLLRKASSSIIQHLKQTISHTQLRSATFNNQLKLFSTTLLNNNNNNNYNTINDFASKSILTFIQKKNQQTYRNIPSQFFLQTSAYSSNSAMTEKPFLPKKALVLRKFSRLEYERLCHPNLSEEQLASNLSSRGSVYESLQHYDQIQKSCLHQIESVLKANKIEYVTVDRFGYTEDKIEWADVIITSGGDGTFLMAASKVTTRNKPIIGVNSDPTKSVGHLCLPSKFSDNFDRVIELLKEGKYQWLYKQRLRVTLIGEAADEDPRELNDIRYNLRGTNQFLDQDDSQDQLHSPARGRSPFQSVKYQQLPGPLNCKFPAILPPNSTTTSMSQTDITRMDQEDNTTSKSASSSSHNMSSTPRKETKAFHRNPNSTTTSATNIDSSSISSGVANTTLTHDEFNNSDSSFISSRRSFQTVDGKVLYKIRQLKERALNEVFVGETLSARVSYYELSVDNNRLIKMKSSGLTVCTGTGSTSWYYNINKLTEQQVRSIAEIMNKVNRSTKLDPNDTMLIGEITRQFNDTLTFAATEPIMAYSIRDPVDYASAIGHSHRGYAKRIEVKSRMQNACLVLDGCQFYPFNDGSYTLIEVFDEDALKTVLIE